MDNKEKLISFGAKLTKTLLDGVVKAEANAASCFILHEPKAPAKLKEFRKKK